MKKAKMIAATALIGASFVGGIGATVHAESPTIKKTTNIKDEQKQMALNTLLGLYSKAQEGKVYGGFSDQFVVGETTRTEVYNSIGKPYSVEGNFKHYSGSMGQASYDFSYDKKGVLKEVRYFGTNVERPTNLGGITPDMMIKHLGKEDRTHIITGTNETNHIYDLGDYALEFVESADHTISHVNLVAQ
ncbi:DUF4309 domain-containing protein [Priestia filamentosa]|uniref:DUF4309 domain-containing protein n=1 Tax=Priestia filamentosa TaxID=1402861 RepID=UPI00397CF03E